MRTFSVPRAPLRGGSAPRDLAVAARTQGYEQARANWGISNEWLASIGILSLVCVTLFGSVGVLLFIASTALLVVQQPKRNLAQVVRFAPFLAIPLLAIISAQWSQAPAATMRSGLQLMLTFVAAIVIARNMRPERMILVLFVGFAAICFAVLPNVPTSLATGMPLSSAILGSKNQVAFSAYMLATLALALVIDPAQPPIARLLAIAAIPVAAVFIWLAQSGGGVSSLLMAMIVVPGFAVLCWLKLGIRVAALVFVLGVLAIALVFQSDIEAAIAAFRTNTLNKDATLTGRTYLWEVAARLSAERPWLGMGYGSFWRQGNIEAEGLWRWAGIPNRSGFNFHNSFVGIKVELGLIGEGLLFVTCAVIGVVGFVRQLVSPTPAMACLLGLLVVAYARSYVEDGLVAPFSIATIIWLATAVYAFAPNIATIRTGLSVDRVRKAL